jgi:hypothetical protein
MLRGRRLMLDIRRERSGSGRLMSAMLPPAPVQARYGIFYRSRSICLRRIRGIRPYTNIAVTRGKVAAYERPSSLTNRVPFNGVAVNDTKSMIGISQTTCKIAYTLCGRGGLRTPLKSHGDCLKKPFLRTISVDNLT